MLAERALEALGRIAGSDIWEEHGEGEAGEDDSVVVEELSTRRWWSIPLVELLDAKSVRRLLAKVERRAS